MLSSPPNAQAAVCVYHPWLRGGTLLLLPDRPTVLDLSVVRPSACIHMSSGDPAVGRGDIEKDAFVVNALRDLGFGRNQQLRRYGENFKIEFRTLRFIMLGGVTATETRVDVLRLAHAATYIGMLTP